MSLRAGKQRQALAAAVTSNPSSLGESTSGLLPTDQVCETQRAALSKCAFSGKYCTFCILQCMQQDS